MAGSVRNVSVRFTAEIQGFRQAMAQAADSTRQVSAAADESGARADSFLGRMVEAANENRDAWDTAGASLLGVGTAAVAGLGLAGKAAMDWESAWAGVTKTVDGTPAQMDELEASLRGLAKTLPATHEEIAGVAEAAGQLGVKREDVVGFTETMIALGETTNLSADEAATAIAQISNVMGTMEREGSEGVERFSATLVALGNAGASTEAEIVAMAQRIAGAGKLVGASESDVLALANAMASVGIEAQLGGGVMSRVMQRMYADVKTGGEGLENLAKVAGVSSKDFATAFETDPVRAVDAVVQGLNKVKESGGNVIDTMADLGIKGTEETSVILRLAGAGDLLSESLTLGDAAWKSNSALAEEAAKRYETTEAKVQIAWNNIKDAAIDAGAVLLPMIAGVAESVAGMAQAFGSLPEPVKGALTVLGGVVGVAALGAGAFLTLAPRILDTMTAFNRVAPAGGRARSALGTAGKAAGIAALGFAAFVAVAKLVETDMLSKIDTGMGKVALSLAEISSNGPGAATALDQLFKDRDGGDLVGSVTDLESAIKRTFNKDASQAFNDWGEELVNGMTGIKGSSQVLGEQFERLDAGLADLVGSGKAEDAAKSFEKIKTAAENQGVSIEDLVKKFPQYADALKQAEADAKAAGEGGDKAADGITAAGDAAGESAGPTEEMAAALDEVGVSADGAVTDLVKFAEALVNAGLLQLSARDAARNLESAIDAVSESVAANGKTLDITTEKGRANQAALDAIAGAGFGLVKANAAAGESEEVLQGNLNTTYNKLIAGAGQFGITGQAAIDLARDILQVPPGVTIESWMSDAAKRMAEATTGAVNAIPPYKGVTIGINTVYTETGPKPGGYVARNGIPAYNATGGRVNYLAGGGQPTLYDMAPRGTDTVPTMLTPGEFVVNAADTAKNLRTLEAINAGEFSTMPAYANAGGAREYAASSVSGHAGSSAGSGGLSSEDRALLTSVAERPIINELILDGRKLYSWVKSAPQKYRDR